MRLALVVLACLFSTSCAHPVKLNCHEACAVRDMACDRAHISGESRYEWRAKTRKHPEGIYFNFSKDTYTCQPTSDQAYIEKWRTSAEDSAGKKK